MANRIVELGPIDMNMFEPTESELEEYAATLGIDAELERDLFPIARDGLVAALPKPWVVCRVDRTDGTVDYFYFNKQTGESCWDHPLDEEYRQSVAECRAHRQCYIVSIALLKKDAQSHIQGTNLAGDVVVTEAISLDESFGAVEDQLRRAIGGEEGRVLCFARPDGKFLGFSCRSKPVKDVFAP